MNDMASTFTIRQAGKEEPELTWSVRIADLNWAYFSKIVRAKNGIATELQYNTQVETFEVPSRGLKVGYSFRGIRNVTQSNIDVLRIDKNSYSSPNGNVIVLTTANAKNMDVVDYFEYIAAKCNIEYNNDGSVIIYLTPNNENYGKFTLIVDFNKQL